jgi:hypothetical protein
MRARLNIVTGFDGELFVVLYKLFLSNYGAFFLSKTAGFVLKS